MSGFINQKQRGYAGTSVLYDDSCTLLSFLTFTWTVTSTMPSLFTWFNSSTTHELMIHLSLSQCFSTGLFLSSACVLSFMVVVTCIIKCLNGCISTCGQHFDIEAYSFVSLFLSSTVSLSCAF